MLPEVDSPPEERLRAAETLADRLPRMRSADVPWAALPSRPLAPRFAAERRASIERVLGWARAAGAHHDGVEFVVDARGNATARAARDLAPGHPIISVPRRLMIVDNEVSASGLPPRDALAAWLGIDVRDRGSRWHAYLDTLPVQLPELPMFKDDLTALAGTTAYEIAAEDVRDIRATYDALPANVRARLSLADFAWGCAIVKSRGFHAPGSIEHRLALVPVVDLMNHRLGDTTWSYDPLDGNFVVSAERAFERGDEVCFSYGDRSNMRLLVHFGFTDPANRSDEGGLSFDLPSDPVNAAAASLLWGVPLDRPARVPVAPALDFRFRRALSLARLHVSDRADRERAAELGLGVDGEMPWLGAAHEAKAFRVIETAARRALDAIGSHVAGDDEWGRSCTRVRDGERAVLEEIVEVAAVLRAHLDGTAPVTDRDGAPRLVRQYVTALDG